MGSRGRQSGRYSDLLAEVVPTTPNLYIDDDTNAVGVRWFHEVPTDEFGIPDRIALLQLAIGATGCRTQWRGYLDTHHVVWPGADYRQRSNIEADSVAGAFRELGALKLRIPRQLHDLFHAAFSPPTMPDEDAMVQFVSEDMQIRSLLRTLLPDVDERKDKFIDPAREIGRYAAYLELLDHTHPTQIGHLPDLEYLASLSIDDARETLKLKRSILKYEGQAQNQ